MTCKMTLVHLRKMDLLRIFLSSLAAYFINMSVSESLLHTDVLDDWIVFNALLASCNKLSNSSSVDLFLLLLFNFRFRLLEVLAVEVDGLNNSAGISSKKSEVCISSSYKTNSIKHCLHLFMCTYYTIHLRQIPFFRNLYFL